VTVRPHPVLNGSKRQAALSGGQDAHTLRALLNAPTEARVLIDEQGNILALNERACDRLSELAGRKLGRKLDRLLGVCIYDLFPPNLAIERQARNAAVLRSGEISRFEDQREGRWMDNTICPVLNEEGDIIGLAILSRDITELKAAQDSLAVHAKQIECTNQYLMEALEKLAKSEQELGRALSAERERARRDSLTGVLNHGAIIDEVRTLVAEHPDRTFAVAMVDVDGMKTTNDTFGHPVGDQVLVHVARAMSRRGAIVGRYGGDEFLALLPKTAQHAAEGYCREVHDAVAQASIAPPESGARVLVQISIGLAMYPRDGDLAAELIKLADSAMYETRRSTDIDTIRRGKAA
jgi:diguanylate cyclase (GGDEF)-like protein/PAS domain S-box-containing protein